MSENETTYVLENAPSGRAKCKKCKETIAKGELRIATHSYKEGQDFKFTSYTRPKYFTVPPRALKGVSPEEFVDIHLQDETTDNILDDPIQKAEIIAAIAYKPSKKKAGEAANGPTTPLEKLLDQIKTTMEKLDDDEEERPKKKAKTNSKAKKKGKKGTEDDVDLEACARAMKVYGKMKADDLKSVIRWNLGYGTTGTKNILLLKCIDGHVNGRLGRCPTCFKGKLNIVESDAGATVSCKGYFDEEIQNRIPCQYTAPATSAPRHKPWYSTEPTEEESDAIKAITEKHLSLAEGGSSDGVLPPALAAAAKKLDDDDEWDTSNRKWAAQTMVDLCTSGPTHVDLPQDEKKARMAIGKLILSNPNSTAGEILELVVKEFGIAAAKEEAKSKQKSALANSCGNAANAGIVQALQELGDLYFKDGNSNAGLTYKKAIAGITGLDYEITADNAKGLCKAKTKVAGIGKGTADKIFEYCTTGTIQKLEEKRKIHS